MRRKIVFAFLLLGLILTVSACTSKEIVPTVTNEVPAVAPSKTSTPTMTMLPTIEASSTPIPEIVHQSMPNNPEYFISQFIRDCNTGNWITPGVDIERSYSCDAWIYNSVERPYDKEFKTFYPEFDIVSMQMGQDDIWMYAQFEIFKNSSTESIEGFYALELDLNLDLRGDILILAKNPVQGDWSTVGVEVWQDTNLDNGGYAPMVADFDPDKVNPGNGYDKLLVNEGKGDDPDIAWLRLSPSDPNIVEISFKRSLINNDQSFEWWGWASRESLLPEKFDLHDNYSDTDLYGIDNSCGWLFGLAPDTTISNLCYIEPTPTQTPVPTVEGCVQPPMPTYGCTWIWFPDSCEWKEFC